MSRNKKTSESLFQFMNLLIALLMKTGNTAPRCITRHPSTALSDTVTTRILP